MTISRVRWALLGAAGFVALSLVSAVSAKDELPKAVRSVLADEIRLGKYDWSRRQRLGAELVAAKNSDTSPTHRGILIRTRLFCQEIPPPPGNVDTDKTRTTLERLG